MSLSGHPLFALIPPHVLTRAKELAKQFDAEDKLQDLMGRQMFFLIGFIVVAALGHILTAAILLEIASQYLGPLSGWRAGVAALYALAICIGGTGLIFSTYVAWLEVTVFRSIAPLLNPESEGLRFYRRSTWLSLIPFSAIPILIDSWFSQSYFFAMVFVGIIAALVAVVAADV